MGHILRYYQDRAIARPVIALVQQDSFQRTMLEKIDAITQCSDAIDKEAAVIAIELGAESNQVVKKTKRVAEAVYEQNGVIQDQNILVYQKVGDVQDSVETLRRTWSSDSEAREMAAIEREKEAAKQRDQVLEIVNRQSEHIQLLQDALNKVGDLLEESPRLRDLVEAKGRGKFPANYHLNPQLPTKTSHHTAKITPNATPQKQSASKLLSRLRYEKETPRNDMRANLQLALTLSLQDQDEAVYMMQSNHLQNWLRTPRSSVLLVDGSAHASGNQHSPFAFVCAKLANALRQARNTSSKASESIIINLYFFCGEHADWRDNPDNGPAGVMNSLLAQLLTQYKYFDLSLIKHLSTLDSDDIKALANVFGKLLVQLPAKMIVFCIIDGLSCYDDEERSEECQQLSRKLIAFSRQHERKGSCVFKLLVAAPLGLRVAAVDELDELEEVLRIPEGLGKGGGFTDMKWNISAGQDIADLSEPMTVRNYG